MGPSNMDNPVLMIMESKGYKNIAYGEMLMTTRTLDVPASQQQMKLLKQ